MGDVDKETIDTLKQVISSQLLESGYKAEEVEFVADQTIQKSFQEMTSLNIPKTPENFFGVVAQKIQDSKKLYDTVQQDLLQKIKLNYQDYLKLHSQREAEKLAKGPTGGGDESKKKKIDGILKLLENQNCDIKTLRTLETVIHKTYSANLKQKLEFYKKSLLGELVKRQKENLKDPNEALFIQDIIVLLNNTDTFIEYPKLKKVEVYLNSLTKYIMSKQQQAKQEVKKEVKTETISDDDVQEVESRPMEMNQAPKPQVTSIQHIPQPQIVKTPPKQEKPLDPIESFKKTILSIETHDRKNIIENKELLNLVKSLPKKRKEFETQVVSFNKIPKTSGALNFEKEVEELKLNCINPTKRVYEYIPVNSNERSLMITLDNDSQLVSSNSFKITEINKEFNTYKVFQYEGSIKSFIQDYEKQLEFYQYIVKQISYKTPKEFTLDTHLEQTFGQYEVFIFVNILSNIYIPSLVIKITHDKIETSFQELPCDEKNIIYQKSKKFFESKHYNSLQVVLDSWITSVELSMK